MKCRNNLSSGGKKDVITVLGELKLRVKQWVRRGQNEKLSKKKSRRGGDRGHKILAIGEHLVGGVLSGGGYLVANHEQGQIFA